MSNRINVKNTEVSVISKNDTDYISLTDIARFKTDDTSAVIGNWMRNRNTIEFLGIWETLYNPKFKPIEFEGFRKESAEQVSKKGIDDVTAQDTAQDTAQVNELIKKLILCFSGEMSRLELQTFLGIKHTNYFRESYLDHALEAGIIEMT